MKQVININFHGQVVPIEVTAFELLKNYTESLSRYFANEQGKEEIINDIESRIGELFQERLKAGITCITDGDVNAIIKSMGRPEELEEVDEIGSSKPSGGEESTGADSLQYNSGSSKRLFRSENDKLIGGVCGGLANYFGIDSLLVRIIFIVMLIAGGVGFLAYVIMWIALPSSASNEIGGTRKKLFRDPDEKIIAGVCSGIGNYFGVSTWIPRVLFLLPFLSFVFRWGHWGFMDFPQFVSFSFSPVSLFVYIILWLVIPIANNTSEKLEMKGEKVDLHSIQKSVVGEMKEVQQKAKKFGKDARSFAEDKGKQVGAEATNLIKRSSRSLGDIIVLLVKAFAYFIIGCFGIALVVGLFAIAILSIGVFPLKDFLLTDGWQNIFAWGTLVLFIAVPVIGIITWIIRRLAKMKSNRRALRFTFISLWLVGWACFICLLVFVVRDFKNINDLSEQEVVLSNPLVNKLELTNQSLANKYSRNRFFRLEPFEFFGLEDDTVFVKNIEIKLLKSLTDSFRVTMVKMANGRNRRFADTLASLINYGVIQNDSVLLLDKGIAITRKNKFRNQRVIVTVYVPVGKRIRVDKSLNWNSELIFDDSQSDWEEDLTTEYEERGWVPNMDYIMKPDGLYTLDGEPADNRKKGGKKKVKINSKVIYLDENGNKVSIDVNGIQMIEGEGNDLKKEIDKRIDSIRTKIEIDKMRMRMRDSLQKAKDQINQQLQKIAANKNAPEVSGGLYLQPYLLLVNID